MGNLKFVIPAGDNQFQNLNPDNNQKTVKLDTVTGAWEIVDQLGIVSEVGAGAGLNSKIVAIKTVDFAAINTLGAVPSGNIIADLVLPADSFLQGFVAVINTAFITATPDIFFNATPGITNFGALEFASNFVNGKAFAASVVPAIAKVDASFQGGQVKSLTAQTVALKADFVNGAGAPGVNPVNYTAGNVTFYAIVSSFGTAAGYAG